MEAPPRVVSKLNPANAVTASRFLTLPPLYWAVMHDQRQLATVIIIVCGLFDKLDGLFARIFDCRSVFGEIFDASADAICYGFALILVAWHGWAPVPAVALVLGLGVVNAGMRFAYSARMGRTTNYKSYAMERLVGYTAYLIGFATASMETSFFYWMFVPLMAATIVHDAKRMLFDPVPAAAP
jgi:phosphatidylglycerophosphate synthase